MPGATGIFGGSTSFIPAGIANFSLRGTVHIFAIGATTKRDISGLDKSFLAARSFAFDSAPVGSGPVFPLSCASGPSASRPLFAGFP